MSEPEGRPAGAAPTPTSPLLRHWRAGRHGADAPDAVTIAERRLAIVQVAARKGRDGEMAAALESIMGLALPQPGHTSAVRDLCVLWVQPRSWLLTQPWRAEPALAGVVAAACGRTAAIVDLTGGRTVLRLSGAKARDVLAKGCRVDLHPRAFGPGRVAGTVIGHVDTVVHQVDDAPTFDLVVGATYAATFLDRLEQAAAEYGYELI